MRVPLYPVRIRISENQQQTQPTYSTGPHRSGIEPGSHWWEASALITPPSLLPKGKGGVFDLFWEKVNDLEKISYKHTFTKKKSCTRPLPKTNSHALSLTNKILLHGKNCIMHTHVPRKKIPSAWKSKERYRACAKSYTHLLKSQAVHPLL